MQSEGCFFPFCGVGPFMDYNLVYQTLPVTNITGSKGNLNLKRKKV